MSESRRTLDTAGLGLAVVWIAWVGFGAGGGDDAHRAPVVALVVGMVLVVAIARWVSRRNRVLVPGVLALGITLVIVDALPWYRYPAGPPLGYANANATLASLGLLSALAAALATSGRVRWAVTVWLVLAAELGVLVLAARSVAAVLALAAGSAVLAVAYGGSRLGGSEGPRPAVWLGALIVGATLLVTLVIAAGANPLWLRDRAEARGDLWEAALDITIDHPVRGIGPGGFADENPVTRDRDLRWVHQGYLQAGAELGVVGMGLALGSLVWAFLRLYVDTAGRSLAAGLAAAALTVVALHATVDYVLHFAAIPVVLAALFGWGTARAS